MKKGPRSIAIIGDEYTPEQRLNAYIDALVTKKDREEYGTLSFNRWSELVFTQEGPGLLRTLESRYSNQRSEELEFYSDDVLFLSILEGICRFELNKRKASAKALWSDSSNLNNFIGSMFLDHQSSNVRNLLLYVPEAYDNLTRQRGKYDLEGEPQKSSQEQLKELLDGFGNDSKESVQKGLSFIKEHQFSFRDVLFTSPEFKELLVSILEKGEPTDLNQFPDVYMEKNRVPCFIPFLMLGLLISKNYDQVELNEDGVKVAILKVIGKPENSPKLHQLKKIITENPNHTLNVIEMFKVLKEGGTKNAAVSIKLKSHQELDRERADQERKDVGEKFKNLEVKEVDEQELVAGVVELAEKHPKAVLKPKRFERFKKLLFGAFKFKGVALLKEFPEEFTKALSSLSHDQKVEVSAFILLGIFLFDSDRDASILEDKLKKEKSKLAAFINNRFTCEAAIRKALALNDASTQEQAKDGGAVSSALVEKKPHSSLLSPKKKSQLSNETKED